MITDYWLLITDYWLLITDLLVSDLLVSVCGLGFVFS